MTTTSDQNSANSTSQPEKTQSFWNLVWEQFKEHRAAKISLFFILGFIFIAATAPWICQIFGIDPFIQNPMNRYAKMATYSYAPSSVREQKVEEFEAKHPDLLVPLRAEIQAQGLIQSAIDEDVLFDFVAQDPSMMYKQLDQLKSPGAKILSDSLKDFRKFHVFGTDELGRDVFARLLYGTRVSIFVGLLVALSACIIGMLLGSLAGYYGGVIDSVVMRVTDAMLALPTLPVLIVLSAIDLQKLAFFGLLTEVVNQSILKLIFILVLFSWMTVCRLVRAEVLSVKEREFVLAARTLGASDLKIILRHILPHVIAPVLVAATLGIGAGIQFEAALSFLGLGVQQPTPTWGNMLFNAQELIYDAPHLAILPGILILWVTISVNYLGDGLQDAINPKSHKR